MQNIFSSFVQGIFESEAKKKKKEEYSIISRRVINSHMGPMCIKTPFIFLLPLSVSRCSFSIRDPLHRQKK